MTVELTNTDARLLELMATIQTALPEHTSKAVLRRANELETKKRRYLEEVVERLKDEQARRAG